MLYQTLCGFSDSIVTHSMRLLRVTIELLYSGAQNAQNARGPIGRGKQALLKLFQTTTPAFECSIRLCVGAVFGDNSIVTHSMRLLRVTRTAVYSSAMGTLIIIIIHVISCLLYCTI